MNELTTRAPFSNKKTPSPYRITPNSRTHKADLRPQTQKAAKMKGKPHIEVDIYIEYIGDNILIGSIGEETAEPAFAVFNANNLGKATKMCRLSFSAPRYVQHKEKYYCDDWIMSQEEKKELMSILQQKSENENLADNLKEYTIFELLFLSKIESIADSWEETMSTFLKQKDTLTLPDYTQLPDA